MSTRECLLEDIIFHAIDSTLSRVGAPAELCDVFWGLAWDRYDYLTATLGGLGIHAEGWNAVSDRLDDACQSSFPRLLSRYQNHTVFVNSKLGGGVR